MCEAQIKADQKNQAFWNELCGTQLAQTLDIHDFSVESLKKFDDYYLDFYPYLKKHLKLNELKDKNILEVGLGYGTVGQLLASAGGNYQGLDIAENAADLLKHRLELQNLSGAAMAGSILEAPFPDQYFDFIVSIGCLHHTGNFTKAIEEIYRMLKPNGTAMIMVYNKFSWRQWFTWPKHTFKHLIDSFRTNPHQSIVLQEQRDAYDYSNDKQEGAPFTEFFSVRELKKNLSKFAKLEFYRENLDKYPIDELKDFFKSKLPGRILGQPSKPTIEVPRRQFLNGFWARYFGLDIYVHAKKGKTL